MAVSMLSLERRRLASDLVECFNILHGLVNLVHHNIGMEINCNVTRVHVFKRLVLRDRHRVRDHFSAIESVACEAI